MRRILGKKGFSLLELVVVIAIIGILTAMIVPSLSSNEAQKKAVVSGAKDFYSAAQYLVTKYSRYEGFLSNDMMKQQNGEDTENSSDDCILEYRKSLFGNFPKKDYVMISMAVRNSEIVYVNAVCKDTPEECEKYIFEQKGLTKVGNTYKMTPFETVFMQDIDPLFEQQDGVYYAIIKAEGVVRTTIDDSPMNPSMRLILTGFSSDELPIASGEFNDYKANVLLFNEDYRLANGFFMGVCTSHTNASGNYVGVPGTYFSVV